MHMLRYLERTGSSKIAAKYWLLKSSAHFGRLEALRHVYPNSKIIFTHRKPDEVLASVSSIMAKIQGVSSDHGTLLMLYDSANASAQVI